MRICKADGCNTRFEGKGFIVWCSAECGSKIALAKLAKKRAGQQKAERKADKARKEKLKTRSDYIKEAQREFNRYIRLRDADRPCICCGAGLAAARIGGGFDAGHYRSVGSAPHLRFDERNCHAQTKRCNRYGSGRAVDYRRGLIERIGVAAVEEIERDQSPRHYSVNDLKAIKDKYRKLANELEKGTR